jgi:hypothetical protein
MHSIYESNYYLSISIFQLTHLRQEVAHHTYGAFFYSKKPQMSYYRIKEKNANENYKKQNKSYDNYCVSDVNLVYIDASFASN